MQVRRPFRRAGGIAVSRVPAPVELSMESFRRGPRSCRPGRATPSHETIKILDGGVGGEVGFRGTYTVFRDSIEVTDGRDTVTARWSLDGERLRFTDVTP